MESARLSRFPHLSWLRLSLDVPPGGRRLTIRMRGVACGVGIALRGGLTVRHVAHGQKTSWAQHVGRVCFVPADGAEHSYGISSDSGCGLFGILIPRGHLQDIAACDGMPPATHRPSILNSDDAVLRDCLVRLAAASDPNDAAVDVGLDEVARRLVRRLTALNGGGTPDWHDDAGVFDDRTLSGLVAYLDEHLSVAPSLSDMGSLAGMSPSHWARKFRRSTGLSLSRFITRRRILRSLETLKADASIAHVALELGFSSQSHFTRQFSLLTGMTPARYRKLFRVDVG